MKTLGMIGGISPESTIDYYRKIIELHRQQRPDSGAPSIIINSIDLYRALRLLDANDLVGLVHYFRTELERLAAAGANFGLLTANTAHIVFDEVAQVSPIPLISIVEATAQQARRLGLQRLGLIGTRFTMQANFFPEMFKRQQMEIRVPTRDEQDFIHEKYFSELVKGVFADDTRQRLLAIIAAMKDRDGIHGVILGGTELPLILRGTDTGGLPFLDTTDIHVRAAVQALD